MSEPQVTFSSYPFEKVVGYNSESADMSNPKGAIYRLCYGLEARFNSGEIYGYKGEVFNEKHADFLVRLFTAQVNRGSLDVRFDNNWHFCSHSYGSESYVANYTECEMSLMDSEEIDYHRSVGNIW